REQLAVVERFPALVVRQLRLVEDRIHGRTPPSDSRMRISPYSPCDEAPVRATRLHTRAVRAAILTIGNELVSGDVPNTNASWLARRLAPLGVAVRLTAALPDEIETVADF